MDIAINTGSLSLNTIEALERARELGFGAVEVNLQQGEFGYGYTREVDFDFYRRLAGEIEARGLKVTSLHNLGLNGAQVFSSRARGEILKAAVRAGALLGAPVLIVHPADLFSGYEAMEEYFQGVPDSSPPVVEGYDEAWAQLANRHMALCVENVNYWDGTPGTNQPERMARLLDDLAAMSVLDVRRAVRTGPETPTVRAALSRWMDRIGARLRLIHVHDAKGAREHEPSLAADWADMAPLLRGSPARACVLEVDRRHGDDQLRASRAYIDELMNGVP